MFFVMLRILFSASFFWCWLLVFPVSVGMQWNNETGISSVHMANFGSSEQREFTGCTTLMGVGGGGSGVKDNFLQPLFPELEESETLRLSVTIDQPAHDKGCSRSTYNQVQKYEQCGAKENIALLPVQSGIEEPYVKDVRKEVTLRGSLDFVFDGGTAVRYPTKQLPSDWSKKFTISGWININNAKERQYIMSWSDGDTPYRENTGFYVQSGMDGKTLTFAFSHTRKQVNKMCLLRKKWSVNTADGNNTWHFFVLSFFNCNVELQLDGETLPHSLASSYFPAPEKHLQPKFVIGARWVGGVTKYADYFTGKISGLILTLQEAFDVKIMNCVLECKETLSLYSSLPSGFIRTEQVGESLSISGTATMKQFQNIVDDILYSNTNRLPWENQRTLLLEAENTASNQLARKTITVRSIRPVPKINIVGDCSSSGKRQVTKSSNVRICPNIKVAMDSCDTVLDSLTVISSLPLEKNERVFLPLAYVNRFGLTMKYLDSGFTVYGVSDVINYIHIMKHIRYSNTLPTTQEVTRKFEVTVSAFNGLVESNTFLINFQVDFVLLLATPPNNQHQQQTPSSNSIAHHPENENDEMFGFELSNAPEISLPTKLNGKQLDEEDESNGVVIISLIAFVFGVLLLIPAIVFGYRRFNRPNCRSHPNTTTSLNNPSPSAGDHNSSVYFYDWRETPCIKINPSERVSISNDPYADLLLKNSSMLPENSTTDGSVYSDDDDMSDFDNDSIRQLEWDCLEKSLPKLLKNEDVFYFGGNSQR